MASSFANPYLSSKMPELTEEEVKQRGTYNLTYWDDELGCACSTCYGSPYGFLSRNGFDTSEASIQEVLKDLERKSRHVRIHANGSEVRIWR